MPPVTGSSRSCPESRSSANVTLAVSSVKWRVRPDAAPMSGEPPAELVTIVGRPTSAELVDRAAVVGGAEIGDVLTGDGAGIVDVALRPEASEVARSLRVARNDTAAPMVPVAAITSSQRRLPPRAGR